MTARAKAKKSVVTIVGALLVLLGFALVVLPGPGLLVSVAGFAVLATEYAWARRALEVTKKKAVDGQKKVAQSRFTYQTQIFGGIALVAVAIAFLIRPSLPFASPVTSTMLVLSGVILITSAVVARRHYAGDTSLSSDSP